MIKFAKVFVLIITILFAALDGIAFTLGEWIAGAAILPMVGILTFILADGLVIHPERYDWGPKQD